MTIKHLMKTWEEPFLYTERACVVFFQFWNLPWKIFVCRKSVLSIWDQRVAPNYSMTTYILYHATASTSACVHECMHAKTTGGHKKPDLR